MIKARIRELAVDEPVADVEAISFMLGDIPTGTLHRWAQLDGWPRRHSTTSRGRRTEYSITAAKATYERQRLQPGGGSSFVSDQTHQTPAGLAMMRAATLYGLDAAEVDAIVQGAEWSAIEDLERQLQTGVDRNQVDVQWVALVLVVDGNTHSYSYQRWTPPAYLEGAQSLHCRAVLVSDTPPETGP
jgi:hypothetical protein